MQVGAPVRKVGSQGVKLMAMGKEPSTCGDVPVGGQGAADQGWWAELEGVTEMGGLYQKGQSSAFEGGVVTGPKDVISGDATYEVMETFEGY